jgi:hypothetical protein
MIRDKVAWFRLRSCGPGLGKATETFGKRGSQLLQSGLAQKQDYRFIFLRASIAKRILISRSVILLPAPSWRSPFLWVVLSFPVCPFVFPQRLHEAKSPTVSWQLLQSKLAQKQDYRVIFFRASIAKPILISFSCPLHHDVPYISEQSSAILSVCLSFLSAHSGSFILLFS